MYAVRCCRIFRQMRNIQTTHLGSITSSFSEHISPLDSCLQADAAENHCDAAPLPKGQLMIKDHDAEEHREEFTRDRNHDKCQTAKVLDRLEYE